MQRSNKKKSALYLGTTQNRFSASQLPKILPYCKVSTGLHINEKKYIVENEKKKNTKKIFKQFVVFKFQITANESIRAGSLCDFSQLYSCES